MENIFDIILGKIIESLNAENSMQKHYDKEVYDIPFILTTIIQEKSKLTEIFKKDKLLSNCDVSIRQASENSHYDILKIILQPIDISKYEWIDQIQPYRYEIEVSYNDKPMGYCECKPGDKDYNPVYNCCGHGCDWESPEINVKVEHDLLYADWNGDAHSNWEMQKEINKLINDEAELLELKTKNQEIKRIEESIAEMEKRLQLLKGE